MSCVADFREKVCAHAHFFQIVWFCGVLAMVRASASCSQRSLTPPRALAVHLHQASAWR